ncbi:MAG: flagellar basal-body rod protein FlgF [Bacteroidetes bacterium]|nr:MAG: flagellar basal-body rod protein FlgF [Bacteroidota bacterium]
MIKGIFASGSGMQPRLMRLDVIANNIANADTTGYKKDSIFVQILKNAGIAQSTGQGELAGLDVKEFTDFTEGSMRPTGNAFDLAVQGEGFFVVDTPEGVRYTRNGNFRIAETGELVNAGGNTVLGSGGPIIIPNAEKLQTGDLTITKGGEIFLGPTQLGKIRLVTFRDTQSLLKVEGTLFTSEQTPVEIGASDEKTTIRQGYLEESNVEALQEMVQLVELTRGFETDQRTMRYQDSTLEKAMDVGRV